MEEIKLQSALELDFGVGAHDQTFLIVVLVQPLLLKLDHPPNELLNAVLSRDLLIMYVEGGELALHHVADCTWLMLFEQLALVTPCWTCFFGLYKCYEVGISEERRQCARGRVEEVDLTALQGIGHYQDWSAALEATTIGLMKIK